MEEGLDVLGEEKVNIIVNSEVLSKYKEVL